MSIRAIVIGLILAGLIPPLHLFADTYFGQATLIASLLPMTVAGCVLLLVAVNPLLARSRVVSSLRPGEMALIVALALAASYWPGAVFNTFISKLAVPAYWYQTKPNWQSAEVMSYVPGGSARFGGGHVTQPGKIASALSGAEDRKSAHLWEAMSPTAQRRVQAVATADEPLNASQRDDLLRALNELVSGPTLDHPAVFDDSSMLPTWIRTLRQRVREGDALGPRDTALLNRWLMVSVFPEALLPPPAGGAMLPVGGEADPVVVGQAVTGMEGMPGLTALPWRAWAPTLLLWGGLGLLLAGMLVCMVLIVHPQWTRRELLSYPVTRVVESAIRPSEGGGWPAIMGSRLFWGGLLTIVVIRLVNGLNDWFPDAMLVRVPMQFDFTALLDLFPNAEAVPGARPVFRPIVFPIVFGLAFFLTREVSLSLGLAGLVWVAFGALLVSHGVAATVDFYGAEPMNMMRFGTYVAAMLMVLYVGRRYYLLVARGVVRGSDGDEVPLYVVWAARGGLVFAVAMVVMLTRGMGLEWPLSVLFVALTAMLFLVVTRIHVETGAIYIQPFWFPFAVLTGLLGIEAVGPTSYIVMVLATTVLVEGTHVALMPMLANGLNLVDRQERASSLGRITPWLGLSVVVSMMSAVVAAFVFQYHGGLASRSRWAFEWQPAIPFDKLSYHVSDLASIDRLAEATAASGLDRLALVNLDMAGLSWVGLGAALVLGCAIARLRLAWWPIHPVLFLVMGTGVGSMYAGSFLLGWVVKATVTSVGGGRTHEMLKSMAVGIILGESGMTLLWLGVDSAYYLHTGMRP